jgi:hypothetical protein
MESSTDDEEQMMIWTMIEEHNALRAYNKIGSMLVS